MASIKRVGKLNWVYINEIYISGWDLLGVNDGFMIIIEIIRGVIAPVTINIDKDGMGTFGVMATKYENSTSIPPT